MPVTTPAPANEVTEQTPAPDNGVATTPATDPLSESLGTGNGNARDEFLVAQNTPDPDDPFAQPLGGNAPANQPAVAIPGAHPANDPVGVRAALAADIGNLPLGLQGTVNNELIKYDRSMQGIENKIGQLHGDVIPRATANAIKQAEAKAFTINGLKLGDGPGGALNNPQRTELLNLAREGKLDDLLAHAKANQGDAAAIAAQLGIDKKDLAGLNPAQTQAVVVGYLAMGEKYVAFLDKNKVIDTMDKFYETKQAEVIKGLNEDLKGVELVAPAKVGDQPTLKTK